MIKDPFIDHPLANRSEAVLDLIPPEFRGEIARLDRTGDTKIIWDRRNPDEVEMARTTFNTLRGKVANRSPFRE